MKQITPPMLDALAAQAQHSLRLRSNHNLHATLDDPIQRLAIAMEPDTLILPHRHPHTWEVLLPLRGRFVVLIFDDAATVVERAVLGEDSYVLELPANTWHAVLSLDQGGVIFEVKHGPYAPTSEPDFAPWSRHLDAESLNGWYAVAQVGERLSA
ncbi:MAG: WbuC family cupin fold metalloprotein [Pseudomonadota bacterium]